MSLCNFRNWEFASMEMEEAEDQPSPDKKVLNVPLQPEFRSCYDTFKACIDFNWPWICRLHVIIQDEDLLTMEEMAPNTVEVAALESVPRHFYKSCKGYGGCGSRAEKEDRQLKARAAAAGRKRGATDRDQQPPRSGGQDQPAADGWLDDVANHEGTGEGHPGDPDGPDDVDDGRGVMAQEQILNMKNSKNQRSFPGMIL
eukprot:s3552_g11.t2